MYQNLPVYRANTANPNPNGSLSFRIVPGLRAGNLPPSPVTFVVGEAAPAPPQEAAVAAVVALPAPPQQEEQPAHGPLLPLPPQPPAPIVLNPRTLLRNANIQSTILHCLTHCHRALYHMNVQNEIFNSMTMDGRVFYHNLHAVGQPYNATNLYKLIVKGGNTTVLLEERSGYGRPMNRRNFPLSFINDLDISLLINPLLPPVDFTIVRNILMFHLLKSIHEYLNTDDYRANVLADYAAAGVQLIPDAYPQIVHYDNQERVMSENQYTEGILHHPSYTNIPAGCPFMVGIHRDKVYYKPRVSVNGNPVVGEDGIQLRDKIKHDLSVIQIATRSMPENILMEFAIPSKMFVNLLFEWSMSSNHVVFIDGDYRFLLLNPVGIYFDQKYAAAANTRPQKRANRTRRARQIRHRIVNQRVQNGTLRQNYNAKRAAYAMHKILTGYPIAEND